MNFRTGTGSSNLFYTDAQYVRHFSELVHLERKAQVEFHLREIRRLSGRARERVGRAVLNLRPKYEGVGFGSRHILRLSRADMPEHEIRNGDVVLVSRGSPLKEGQTGTVVEAGARYFLVAFDAKPPRWLLSAKKLRIDLYVNDITFQRMLGALKFVETGRSVFPLPVLLGTGHVEVDEEPVGRWFNAALNDVQRTAVRLAMGSSPLFLIHGPPGTGKTITCAEVVMQAVERDERVLITADSNTAVDNLLEVLVKRGVRAVRIGHPARIYPDLRRVSLDVLVESTPRYREVLEIRAEIEKIRARQEEQTRPAPQKRRGLSDEQIMELAAVGRGTRGLEPRELQSMARWIELQRKIDALYGDLRSIVSEAISDVLENAQVVATTNSTSGSEFLRDMVFDLAVVDEATQATEPSTLIPLVRARRAVMAGDHRQLPPTVISMEAKTRLEISMFERLISVYPDASLMLRVQYRMNRKIMEFSGRRFYGGKLIAHESVRDIVLSDILPGPGRDLLDDTPIVFIDTGGAHGERQRHCSKSHENWMEAVIVGRLLDTLISAGISPEHIGVISPYDDQVTLIRRGAPEGVEVKTVDGFQGREKEVIILSLVRSNEEGRIGFLRDLRRLNVAITRARRKLYIVGDSTTLSSEETYKDLLKYIASEGRVFTVDDVLGPTGGDGAGL